MLCGSVERRRRVSTWRKCGQVRRAKDPAPTSRPERDGTLEEEQSRRRKVHSLIDKVYAPANLAEAWKRSPGENKGSAGIDGLTVIAFEDRQAEHLAGLHARLRDQTYRPAPVKRVGIPKLGGGTRNLRIPSVTDRVVQRALVQRMAPIFEPLFAKSRSATDPAARPIWRCGRCGARSTRATCGSWMPMLRSFFDSIDQSKLVDLVAEEDQRWARSYT